MPSASESRKWLPKVTLPRLLCFMLFLGIALTIIGTMAITPKRYVCGSAPPSADEIQARGAPVCLTTNVRSGAMCLMAGEDAEDPAVWCRENVASFGNGSFYLWWSSCSKCGTAWRMFKKRIDNESRFKLQVDRPGPHEVPLSSGDINTRWTEWNAPYDKWESVSVTISECPAADVNADGIPSTCFDDPTIPLIYVFVILILSAMGLVMCHSFASRHIVTRGGGGGAGGGGGGGC